MHFFGDPYIGDKHIVPFFLELYFVFCDPYSGEKI